VQPLLPEYTPLFSEQLPEISPVISISKSRTAVLVGELGKMEMYVMPSEALPTPMLVGAQLPADEGYEALFHTQAWSTATPALLT
jgi:hypothetical protein